MHIGILTGGGDVPGLNACIRAATLAADDLGWRVSGVQRGWKGLLGEPSFPSAVATTAQLALLAEGREPLDAAQLTEVPELLATGYARALYLGSGLRGEEAPPEEVATALAQLRELLAGSTQGSAAYGLDPDPYWRLLEILRREHGFAMVRGAAAGLAFAAGRLSGGRR